MSIYATLRHTTVNGHEVYVQGVPGHIDDPGCLGGVEGRSQAGNPVAGNANVQLCMDVT